jgi:hypothetical protein
MLNTERETREQTNAMFVRAFDFGLLLPFGSRSAVTPQNTNIKLSFQLVRAIDVGVAPDRAHMH